LRKSLVTALAALVALAVAAVAVAQTYPTPAITFKASATPTKAGTKKKPKKTKLRLTMTLTKEARATAERITFLLPRNLVVSARGYKYCPATEIQAEGPSGCPAGSQVGTGTANAAFGPNLTPINFKVTLYTASANELTIYLEAVGLPIKRAIRGIVSNAGTPYGKKLTIDIPEDLQKQLGAYVYLTGLDATVNAKTAKKGKKRYNLLATNGCPADRKHRYELRLDFVNNGQTDPTSTKNGTTSACRK
jgi:hypothetical protein